MKITLHLDRVKLYHIIAFVCFVAGAICCGIGLTSRGDVVAPVALEQLGLTPDHSASARLVAQETPRFQLVGAAAAEDHSRKNVRLWDAMLALRGEHFPNVPQQVGDCVAWGAANAVNYLQAVQLTRGPPNDAAIGPSTFSPADPPYIYGVSRIMIGGKYGSRFRGDGSVGAYAAEGLRDYGCLKADDPQVPPYSGQRAKEWGDKGPPKWSVEKAKPHAVATIAQVNTPEEVRDAVVNGFPVTIASNWGTKTIRPRDGRNVAQHDGSWQHQMCVIGYDGSTGREPYWYVLNSWGPKAHPDPLQGEPPGGFWIDGRSMNHIASQGDCWAFSAFEGFPADDIDWNQLLEPNRVAVAGSRPVGDLHGGILEMSGLELMIGLLLLFAGGVTLWLGNAKRRGRGLSGAALVVVMLVQPLPMTASDTLDFAVASHPPTRTNTVTRGDPTPPTLDWGDIESRSSRIDDIEATGLEPLDWSDCGDDSDTILTPRALVFSDQNCSDCVREISYIRQHIVPLGWTVGNGEETDFQIVDRRKATKIVERYKVDQLPTTIYLDHRGREVRRLVGYDSKQSLTEELNKLRIAAKEKRQRR